MNYQNYQNCYVDDQNLYTYFHTVNDTPNQQRTYNMPKMIKNEQILHYKNYDDRSITEMLYTILNNQQNILQKIEEQSQRIEVQLQRIEKQSQRTEEQLQKIEEQSQIYEEQSQIYEKQLQNYNERNHRGPTKRWSYTKLFNNSNSVEKVKDDPNRKDDESSFRLEPSDPKVFESKSVSDTADEF